MTKRLSITDRVSPNSDFGLRHCLVIGNWSFVLVQLSISLSAGAATSINVTNKYGYGANIGWIDARGNTTAGAVIGEFVCSGYLYSANVGWIHLGSNAPANG